MHVSKSGICTELGTSRQAAAEVSQKIRAGVAGSHDEPGHLLQDARTLGRIRQTGELRLGGGLGPLRDQPVQRVASKCIVRDADGLQYVRVLSELLAHAPRAGFQLHCSTY